ncbi:hypothetical protein [Nitrosomonas sp.]|uniref:hypothetical protein n=1 Tax=Nitrosomonas sp. TaxID=42353 RepID=UPI0025F22CA5|nr:hypothetical protein [Nitrosomonas sp.]MCC6917078.1 hypothetical protein [Nitrosomonas sp.]
MAAIILGNADYPAPQTMGSVFTLLRELQHTSMKQSTEKLSTQSASTLPRIFANSHKKSVITPSCNSPTGIAPTKISHVVITTALHSRKQPHLTAPSLRMS